MPPSRFAEEDLFINDPDIWYALTGGEYRLYYSRPHWDYEDDADILAPDWAATEGESEEARLKRVKDEEKKCVEAYKANYGRLDDESQKETLERINRGRQALRFQLADLGYSIDSEAQPGQWEEYISFKKTAEKEYMRHVLSIVSGDAFQSSPPKPYNPADHPAVLSLGGLSADSVHGEYYAKNICERLAKAWHNGEHRPTFRSLKPGEEYPLWEQRQNELKATGVTIEGGLNDFESCFYTLKSIPAKLENSLKREEAREFYNAYGSCSHKYRNFIQRITTGLKKTNVRQYLGDPHKNLFEAQLAVMEEIEKTASNVVFPLLSSNESDNIKSETATSKRILQEGLNAARG